MSTRRDQTNENDHRRAETVVASVGKFQPILTTRLEIARQCMTFMFALHYVCVLDTGPCIVTIGHNDVNLACVRNSGKSKTEAAQHGMGI